MLRYLPIVIELALLVYCLIDCVQTESFLVRNLPKTLWVVLIVFVPIVGPIAWLVAGRPERQQRSAVPWPSTQTAGFPEYERPQPALAATDPDDDERLRRWEQELAERERRLGDEDDPDARG